MKKRSIIKRTALGFVGVTMAGIMFFTGSLQGVQEVRAQWPVFAKITEKFPSDKSGTLLTILEITPSSGTVQISYSQDGNNNIVNINDSAEMGYFLGSGVSSTYSPTRATKGTAVTKGDFNKLDETGPAVAGTMSNIRKYGLASSPADTTGSYPIYALWGTSGIPLFSDYYTNSTNKPLEDDNFVPGVYTITGPDTGNYNIADGYTINENGTICQIVTENTVSGNDPDPYNVNGLTVSENALTYGYTDDDGDGYYDNVVHNVEVTDVNSAIWGLPESATDPALKYIVGAADAGRGNVTFTVPEKQEPGKTYYLGYSPTTIYYSTNNNAKFYSSEFFREFVLGSRDDYAGAQIDYQVKDAGSIDVDYLNNLNPDLIYISTGSAVDPSRVFSDSVDLDDDVMMWIYEKEVNSEHKAVMMDYNCYDPDSDNNVSNLARLLWQESQNIANSDAYSDDFEVTKDSTGDIQNIALKHADLSDELVAALESTMLLDIGNHNFVTGNVYVYDHHFTDYTTYKAIVDAHDNFANGDFNSSYTASVQEAGFLDVKNYIATYNKVASAEMNASVTPAIAIQYILISDGTGLTVMKEELTVLEIQP
ncbi:MAG: hypothetical protein IK123_04080, partial [Lachnospiraceae bacterium]|nr:hypothetical protein [Lachnospiraceae bacterium]